MSDYYLLNALTPDKGSPWRFVNKSFRDEDTKAAMERLEAKGLLKVNADKSSYGLMVKTTPAAQDYLDNVTRAQKLDEVGYGETTEAERALWAWLLLHGGEPEFYGGLKHGTVKLLHLAVCGLDFSKSSSIESQSWSSFVGTFAEEQGTDTGIGGRAVCRCGAVNHFQVATQHYTIAQILTGALAL